jgi:predicted nucleic acid-binding protein
MHAINLLEVYYGIRREYGDTEAKEMLAEVKNIRIFINYDISESIIHEAGRLKSEYKLSLADSIGLAQAILLNASFVSSDHHELDIVDISENINIHWFR